jgi:hypothetical protein
MRLVKVVWVLGVGATTSAICAAQTWGQTQEQPPAQGQGLEAGGLTPPSSQPEEGYQPPDQTEQELERADREDSGRGLEFFWINGEAGFEHVGLQTFQAKDLVDADIVETTGSGPVFGGGLGLRLVFITAGARFRWGNFAAWQLWTLNAELGIRIPLGILEPHFTLGAGYASLGALDRVDTSNLVGSGNVDITGWDLRASGGLDLYLSNAFSLGAAVSGDFLFLTRPGVDLESADPGNVYAADGSSVGSGVTTTAVVGLHF